jgi:hypothetical protein
MRNMSSTAPQIIGETLVAYGFDAKDFEVEQDAEPELGAALGIVDPLLLLRRRSTGTVRLYLGASWFSSVASDLAAGEFGRPH